MIVEFLGAEQKPEQTRRMNQMSNHTVRMMLESLIDELRDLESKMSKCPNNAQGWLLLGRLRRMWDCKRKKFRELVAKFKPPTIYGA
jgi:cytochrome c-type biogenesis protein CcmH/NrfG